MAENISREFRLEFPKNLVKEPVISDVIKKFDLTANIRRADVDADGVLYGVFHDGSLRRWSRPGDTLAQGNSRSRGWPGKGCCW